MASIVWYSCMAYVIIGIGAVLAIVSVNKLFGVDPIGRTLDIMKKFSVQEKKRSINVDAWIGQYNDLHDDSKTDLTDRNMSYTTLVNAYYELATLFYEWGWGQSFHFAYQLKGETFNTAIARHEYFLAGKLGVKQGDKVLDVGCGIGGPMRNIARFTRADITGVTLNEVSLSITKMSGCVSSRALRERYCRHLISLSPSPLFLLPHRTVLLFLPSLFLLTSDVDLCHRPS